ncbi:hypothetical protein GWK36_07575 [Caldichromatium japonicum]|uniref:EF-hand domain-containing protein n=1 Tax=Caldichromatium japonicum TaxID=2699430 RepID=A0A6G7VDK0_9GAMM|nr:hypothetical protein [Caldichromatium japonicum]QIK37867.1 hypothetical protein GWK36_07575 [Caldichromatium japonicum]
MSSLSPKPRHRWRFRRLGGFDQVSIESGEDIRHLPELDPKLWAVLGCPTKGLHFDAHTLKLLDTDGDGRIRVAEIQEAVRWTCQRLKDPGSLFKHEQGLPLDAIDDHSEEGRQVLAGAFHILDHLERTDSGVITAADTAQLAQVFAGTRFNGDGVIHPGSARDPAIAAVITDIIRCVGSVPDRSGEPGIDQALCDRFFSEAAQYLEWWAEAEQDPWHLLPLGPATETVAAVLSRLAPKIDDYFARTRLAAYDPQATSALNPDPSRYAALSTQDLAAGCPELADWPLARVEPDRPLPLTQGVNPYWREPVALLRTEVAAPLIGPLESLTEEQWQTIKVRLQPHLAWCDRRRGEALALLGPERVKELVAGPFKDAIASLIEQDLEFAGIAEAIESVDRLVHYYQHLETLLQNFVALRDLYIPGRWAVFQAGTLYLDGRACTLCVQVEDSDRHTELARRSGIYLAYCLCRRRGGDETLTIAAAFTAGDEEDLAVGRNGIFYDREGRDWDATIIRLIEHPIGPGEAFWSPYKRFGRLIAQQIERLAGTREQAVAVQAEQGLTQLMTGPAPAAPFDIAKFAGIFAAIGLAVWALGTALASILTGLLSLAWWQFLLVILGLILAISGPSVLLAHLRLRQRNLAPLLDACGWAVNASPKISPLFGATLTQQARLPQGAVRVLQDPFARRGSRWKTLLALGFVAIALALGIWAFYQGGIAARLGKFANSKDSQTAQAPAIPDSPPSAPPLSAPPAAATPGGAASPPAAVPAAVSEDAPSLEVGMDRTQPPSGEGQVSAGAPPTEAVTNSPDQQRPSEE